MRLKFLISKAINMLSAMHISTEFPILELPNELIACIVEHIDKRATLQRLACTCRRMQQLTEPALYRSILISDYSEAREILRALNACNDRCAAVQILDFPLSDDISRHAHRSVFKPYEALINRTINVRELMIESPSCNSAEFEDPDQWERMTDHLFAPFRPVSVLANDTVLSVKPLQKLKKLTLHMNGPKSPYWDIDSRSFHLFLHPTLQWMKLSCVNIIDGSPRHEGSNTRTPVKHLVLEECNISHNGLSRVLSLPKALEMLYLGENVHNKRHFYQTVPPSCNHLFDEDPTATIAALTLQKDSLKELTYVTTEVYYQVLQLAPRPSFQYDSHTDGSFSDFHCLEKVTLCGQYPNFERAVMTMRSPPNLQTLCLKSGYPFRARDGDYHSTEDISEDIQRYTPFLRAPSASISATLKDLDVTYDSFMRSDNAKRELITAAAKKAKQVGINMRVLYQEHTRFFPPYLYGEQEPKEEVVYCNGQFVGKFAERGRSVSDEESNPDDSESEWVSDDD